MYVASYIVSNYNCMFVCTGHSWETAFADAVPLVNNFEKNKVQMPYTCRNPKKYISLVSLFLYQKIVAV